MAPWRLTVLVYLPSQMARGRHELVVGRGCAQFNKQRGVFYKDYFDIHTVHNNNNKKLNKYRVLNTIIERPIERPECKQTARWW